jgi:EpsD family peptidyl-prolyl cis-trans isomerase
MIERMTMNVEFSKKMFLPLMLAAAVAVSGCGGDKKKTEEKGGTQVAAKVNGTELTVHQVNFALQRIPNLDKDKSKEASLQVIRSLVDQEVIVQKAMGDKLDRDPAVVQAMDAARRQILAEAYMGRKLGTPVVPSAAEVTDYYNKHPEFFSQRKMFRLQEIAIKAPKDKHAAIRAQLAASKTLNEFGEWLKAEKYPVKASQGVKASEQLPPAILPNLQKMPDGQAMVVATPEGLLVLVLAGSQAQPVTEVQAKPAIESLLQNQKRQEAAKQELDTLKAAAKIEYLGEFVDAGKAPVAAKEPAPATPAPAAASKAAPAGPSSDAISKGISGL